MSRRFIFVYEDPDYEYDEDWSEFTEEEPPELELTQFGLEHDLAQTKEFDQSRNTKEEHA